VTEGLDGLRERLNEYARLGAVRQWRAVITIGDDAPSGTCSSPAALAPPLCREAGMCRWSSPRS
jgi:fructose-bisphosphate aldolase class I